MSHCDTLCVKNGCKHSKDNVALLHYWWLNAVTSAQETLITANCHYWRQTHLIPEDLSPTTEETKENVRHGQQYDFHTHVWSHTYSDDLIDCLIEFFHWLLSFRGVCDEGVWLCSLHRSSCTSDLPQPAQLCRVSYRFSPSKGAFTLTTV